MALDNPHFTASYERIFGTGAAMGEAALPFFQRFYERFLDRPGIAPLFADTDVDRLAQMLRKSLFHLVTFQMLNEPTPELSRLGRLHAEQGITPVMFDDWLAALLETIEEFDAEFDELTQLAWCWALAPGLSYVRSEMLEASRAPARSMG